MKKVLITGAYGFVGKNTSLKFKENGYVVYGCGHGFWNNDEYTRWGIDHWLSGDISIELLHQFNIKPDVIVHCAGSGSVGLSIENPTLDFDKTVTGTMAVLEFIRIYSPNTKFIYPSSAAVYGEHIDAEISVNEPLIPASPYGVHKKIVEELCWSYHHFFRVNCSIIRFFSIYGPGLKKQLLWDACNKLTKSSDIVEFWGTGDETRDWIYISDATELIYLNAISSHTFSIMNGGVGEKNSVKETLSILLNQIDRAGVTVCFNNIVREGDPKFYHADMSEAKQFGWSAKIELKEGLKKYVNWFEDVADD